LRLRHGLEQRPAFDAEFHALAPCKWVTGFVPEGQVSNFPFRLKPFVVF